MQGEKARTRINLKQKINFSKVHLSPHVDYSYKDCIENLTVEDQKGKCGNLMEHFMNARNRRLLIDRSGSLCYIAVLPVA
jgi:hypothetical protein